MQSRQIAAIIKTKSLCILISCPGFRCNLCKGHKSKTSWRFSGFPIPHQAKSMLQAFKPSNITITLQHALWIQSSSCMTYVTKTFECKVLLTHGAQQPLVSTGNKSPCVKPTAAEHLMAPRPCAALSTQFCRSVAGKSWLLP